jgi:hypothetical protein
MIAAPLAAAAFPRRLNDMAAVWTAPFVVSKLINDWISKNDGLVVNGKENGQKTSWFLERFGSLFLKMSLSS